MWDQGLVSQSTRGCRFASLDTPDKRQEWSDRWREHGAFLSEFAAKVKAFMASPHTGDVALCILYHRLKYQCGIVVPPVLVPSALHSRVQARFREKAVEYAQFHSFAKRVTLYHCLTATGFPASLHCSRRC